MGGIFALSLKAEEMVRVARERARELAAQVLAEQPGPPLAAEARQAHGAQAGSTLAAEGRQALAAQLPEGQSAGPISAEGVVRPPGASADPGEAVDERTCRALLARLAAAGLLRYVVPTFFDRRVKKSEEIFTQLQAYYPTQLCSPIRYNVRLSEAPGYGQTIYEFASSSIGAADYTALTERIKQDDGTQGNA